MTMAFDFVSGIFILPFILLSTILPLAAAVWVIIKIQSIDSTLKEISRKLDREKNQLL